MKRSFLRGMMLLLLGIPIAAYSQFSSNLQGTVTDPSGAVIPAATVTLLNTATGVLQKTTAGPQGVYLFVSIAPGSYTVTTSAPGFATHDMTQISTG